MKKAFITGVTGQDGSYLAELLLDKGYEVHGLIAVPAPRTCPALFTLVDNPNFYLVSGDLIDQHSLTAAMQEIQPDEVYNLAAQSFVETSWKQPVLTGEYTAIGVTKMLEAVRYACPKAKFYQASSSEMFGKVQEVPQSEKTPFYPRSPYGVAKVYGHWITVNYRESLTCSLFPAFCLTTNRPGADLEFVTRKISQRLPGSNWANRIKSVWATWIPSATGVLPAITSRLCG